MICGSVFGGLLFFEISVFVWLMWFCVLLRKRRFVVMFFSGMVVFMVWLLVCVVSVIVLFLCSVFVVLFVVMLFVSC